MKIVLSVRKGCPIRARPTPAQLEFSRLPHASSTVFTPALRAFRRATFRRALDLHPAAAYARAPCLRRTSREKNLPRGDRRSACTRSLAASAAAGFQTRANASRFGLSRELRVGDAFILQRLPSLSQFGIHRLLRRCEFHPRFLLAAQLRQDPAAQKMASMKFRRQAKRRINHFQSLLCFLLLLIKLRQPEIRPGVLRIPLQRLAK